MERVEDLGGAVAAIEQGFQKSEIENSAYAVALGIDSGERIVVGLNRFRAAQRGALRAAARRPLDRGRAARELEALRAERDSDAVSRHLDALKAAAQGGDNVPPPDEGGAARAGHGRRGLRRAARGLGRVPPHEFCLSRRGRANCPAVQIPFTPRPARASASSGSSSSSTGRPASCAPARPRSSAELSPGGEHPKAKHELLESTIEVITGVCSTVAEASADLAGTVAELVAARRAARPGDDVLRHAPDHPLVRPVDQPRPPLRTSSSTTCSGWPGGCRSSGCTSTSGSARRTRCMPIVNALTAYIPHFLALSASSPVLAGRRHRPRLRPVQGLRGAADGRAALPAVRLARSSRSSWTR